MRFESQWPGDATAAPICDMLCREEDVRGRSCGASRNWTDGHSLGAGDWHSRRSVVIRSVPNSDRWGPSNGAALSLVLAHVVEGFALSAAAMHPEFLSLASEQASRADLAPPRRDVDGRHPIRMSRSRRKCRSIPRSRTPETPARVETARADFIGWRKWITPIKSVLTGLWPRKHHARKVAHIRADWESLDDRTLNDIGISRSEIEYLKHEWHWM
jgi:uncharacterized protein YjiS (DUF1127 family)